jgi:hypothetical protein
MEAPHGDKRDKGAGDRRVVTVGRRTAGRCPATTATGGRHMCVRLALKQGRWGLAGGAPVQSQAAGSKQFKPFPNLNCSKHSIFSKH